MLLLLIIADDFTGALDTGVQFAAYGAATRVMVKDQVDSVYSYHRIFSCGSKILDSDSDQDSSDNVSCDIFCKFQSFVLIHDNNLLDVDGM